MKDSGGAVSVGRVPGIHKACSSVPNTVYTMEGVHTCSLSTWDVEVGDQKFMVIFS